MHFSQVLPVQQVSHDVTGDALGSVADIKRCVLCHVICCALGQLKHHGDNLQQQHANVQA
jgi:hypothetical protein